MGFFFEGVSIDLVEGLVDDFGFFFCALSLGGTETAVSGAV